MVAVAREEASWAVRAARLFVICMAPSLGGLVPLALAVAQPAIAEHFGGGPHGRLLARTLFALPSLMIVFGAPLGGWLAQRLGYRRSMLLWLLVYGIAGSAGLLVGGFAPLLATRLVLGFAGGAIMAVYLPLTAAYWDGPARAQVLGLAVGCSAVFGMLALALGGGLVDRGGWQAPFALYLSAFAALAAGWLGLTGAATIPPAPAGTAPGRGSALAQIGTLWPVYALLLLMSIGTFLPSAGGPFLLKEYGIDSAGAQGLILSAGSFAALFTSFGYGYLRRPFSDRALLALGAAFMGAGLVGAVPAGAAAGLLAAFTVAGLGTGVKAPGVASVLMAEAPPELRAAAAGFSFSSLFLGQLLAPFILEALDRTVGMDGAFLAVGGLLLAAAPLVAIFGLVRGRPAGEAAPAAAPLAAEKT
jgi:MFS family permease